MTAHSIASKYRRALRNETGASFTLDQLRELASYGVLEHIAMFQLSSPVPVAILALRCGGRDVEQAYHHQFSEHRLHGEWFKPHPDILAEIERLNTNSLAPCLHRGGVMGAAAARRSRKVRRRAKMVQRSGGKHAVNHRGKSGRTGQMHSKKLKSRRHPREQ